MTRLFSRSFVFLFLLLFFLLISEFAFAAQIKLAWDVNTESDLAGYKVYYGTSSKSYVGSTDVGNVTAFTLTGLTQGQTYYTAVTAYNTLNQESGYSSEVSGVAVEPTSPTSETPPTITPEPTPTPSDRTPGKRLGWTKKPRTGSSLYMAVSEISASTPSIGNIKKYEVSTTQDSSTGVQVGEVLDSEKTPVLDTNSVIKDSSKSNWSSQTDGMQVDKGGVGEVLLTRSRPRRLFTNLGDSSLSAESNAFTTSNAQITPELLGLSSKDSLERERVIQYTHGYDAYTKTKDSTTLKKRKWILGSIVHSRPLVIPYDDSRSVIYVGANDGMFHAFDDATGEELWGFIPKESLGRLKDLRGSGVKYYVDGSSKAYITESQKIIIFGLRRGGSNYYALDVTDPESPKFLWKIGPETPGYAEMAQSWSTPQIGKIRFGTSAKVVSFIGGGYDENQDKKTVTTDDKRGRAVYVVDVLTGEQIWRWDYGRDSNMRYSIPSDISRVDTNGDGYIDRLYVGDMGGRMWRFDLKDPDTNTWSGRVFFHSSNGSGSGRRKIFYPPDVTLEKGYETVFLGTGDREHPNDTSVINGYYALKDRGLNTTLTEGNLEDVTDGLSAPDQLARKEGWFFRVDANKGEKVTGGSVVAYGAVYFTTFTPSTEKADGIARVYALNYQNGNPILNLNPGNDADGVKIDLSDRSRVIGTGMPSGTVITSLNGKLVAYTGFNGGMFRTPLRKTSSVVPVWWRQVF